MLKILLLLLSLLLWSGVNGFYSSVGKKKHTLASKLRHVTVRRFRDQEMNIVGGRTSGEKERCTSMLGLVRSVRVCKIVCTQGGAGHFRSSFNLSQYQIKAGCGCWLCSLKDSWLTVALFCCFTSFSVFNHSRIYNICHYCSCLIGLESHDHHVTSGLASVPLASLTAFLSSVCLKTRTVMHYSSCYKGIKTFCDFNKVKQRSAQYYLWNSFRVNISSCFFILFWAYFVSKSLGATIRFFLM